MKIKCLPGYIPPEKDELFSSWLIRLSKEHYTKSFSFSKHYFNGHPIWNRDIDKMYPEVLINILSDITPLNFNEIKNLFLITYKEKLFKNIDINSPYSGVLRLGLYHRKRTGYGLLCCPNCLSIKKPYYKKTWRLFFSVACLECKSELIDRCPQCSTSISFHRLESGYKNEILTLPIYHCYNCFFDLRKISKPLKQKHELLLYQSHIENTVKLGYNNVSNYSFTYFPMIYYIASRLHTKSQKWNRIKLHLQNHYKCHLKDLIELNNNLNYRKTILLLIYDLFKDWPTNFLYVFRQSKIRLSDFTKDSNNVPYWLIKQLYRLD